MSKPDDHSEDRWPYWDQDFEEGSESGRTPTEKQQASGQPVRKSAKFKPESFQDAMQYAGLGTELFAAVLVGAGLGWLTAYVIGLFTDYDLTTSLVSLGIVLGTIAGFVNMYHVVLKLEAKEEQHRRDSSK